MDRVRYLDKDTIRILWQFKPTTFISFWLIFVKNKDLTWIVGLESRTNYNSSLESRHVSLNVLVELFVCTFYHETIWIFPIFDTNHIVWHSFLVSFHEKQISARVMDIESRAGHNSTFESSYFDSWVDSLKVEC